MHLLLFPAKLEKKNKMGIKINIKSEIYPHLIKNISQMSGACVSITPMRKFSFFAPIVTAPIVAAGVVVYL